VCGIAFLVVSGDVWGCVGAGVVVFAVVLASLLAESVPAVRWGLLVTTRLHLQCRPQTTGGRSAVEQPGCSTTERARERIGTLTNA